MSTAPTLLSIEEYLHTSYKPDADFVDGELEERNVGEYEHGTLQGLIYFVFESNYDKWGTDAVPEQRIRVNSSRIRVCDLAVLLRDAPHEHVTSTPPLICIEVLSPEDRLSRAKFVLEDYFAMGVPNIWLLDPIRRTAYTFDASGLQLSASASLSVSGTAIALDLRALFARLDMKIAAHKPL